jgi:hypothetical protein
VDHAAHAFDVRRSARERHQRRALKIDPRRSAAMQVIHRLRAPRYYFYVKNGGLGRRKNGLLGRIRNLRA